MKTPTVAAYNTTGQQSPDQSNQQHSILGHPSLSAARIDQILAAYHSPATGLGRYIYDRGLHYGIDPVHVLAIFLHESQVGTAGEARKTMSPGNERCIADRPCVDQSLGGYAQMQSWADGFEHLYSLLFYGYIKGQVTIPLVGHVCTTIEQIVPVFAPSSDGNDVQVYINAWIRVVDGWRAGRVWI